LNSRISFAIIDKGTTDERSCILVEKDNFMAWAIWFWSRSLLFRIK
jgi:hypothetical protein